MDRRTRNNVIALGLLALFGVGFWGCAGHQTPVLPGQAFSRPEELGPTVDNPPPFQFAQTETKPLDPDDPFADPTDDEDLDFLDELEDEEPQALIADPLEPWNRLMFQVNDRLYFWVLKSVAQGYRRVVPAMARRGVKNFFYNIATPVRLANNLLQGRPKAAGAELGRFVVNTTEGILGFGDPASRYPELVIPPEDLGQTFGRYGIGNGVYLVWPLLGPSSLRDTLGLAGDILMDPINLFDLVEVETRIGLTGLDVINETSFRIGDYETFKEAALDPYYALRNGYVQRRNQQIRD